VDVKVRWNTEKASYEVDSYFRKSSVDASYMDIVNFALSKFTPSDPELFSKYPFVEVFIRESVTRPNQAQARFSYFHVDKGIGGFIKDGVMYDGQFLVNSVDDSCILIEEPTSSANPSKEEINKLVSEGKHIGMKKGYLYWISEKTLHLPVTLEESVQRQFLAICLGSYLSEENREYWDLLKASI
jgi:hypothetical protein